MGKYDGEYYSKLFDAIELIHAENVLIMSALLKMNSIDNKTINKITDSWDERLKEIRKW